MKKTVLVLSILNILINVSQNSFAQTLPTDGQRWHIVEIHKWIYEIDNNAPPSSERAKFEILPFPGIPGGRVFRGNLGARDCADIAVIFYDLGYKDEAFEWLLASEWQDDRAKDALRVARDWALNYFHNNQKEKSYVRMGITSGIPHYQIVRLIFEKFFKKVLSISLPIGKWWK